ncbi:amphoterin-induced 1-like [Brachionus plicatilis]|uniref:Amphoterin-induced 1-like n=1 Tax=Brachionus plicatilis TaxID=10195 RepID=A0A3M7Q2G5_BRAPC|nr:amphoterin-induced 1-like [Brachionus plicatilis]
MIDFTNEENVELTPFQIDIDITESFRDSLSLRNYDLLYLDRLNSYTGIYNRYIRIELINVNVDQIPYNFFANCTHLEHLNLSKNQISSLDSHVFFFNKNLRYIDLSNNQLGIIDLTIFSHLKYLKSIFLQNNLITQIDNEFSNENTHLKYVYLTENKIYRLDCQISNRKVNLLKLDLCKNRIEFISEKFFQDLKCDYIDLTENPLFDFIYSKNIDDNIKFFRVDHDYYENNYENLLMSLFDRKQPSKSVNKLDKSSKSYYYYFVINDLFKCEKVMRRLFYSESNFVCAKFEEIFEEYKLGNKTILDLLIKQENFGLTDFKEFKKKLDSFLKDHSVENVEMKFKCSQSFMALCERNDTELVEKIFPIEAMYRFCKKFETVSLEEFIKSEEYNKDMIYYVTDSSFLLNIDYEKCLKIAYDKKNIKLIFYIFLLIKYTLINSKFDKGNDSVDYFKSHKNSFKLDKILIQFRDEPSMSDFFFQFLFNEKMVKKFESTKGIVSRTNHSLYESCKQELLTALSLVRRENLLKNELIQKIYKQLWSGVPRFMYSYQLLPVLFFDIMILVI